MGDNREILKKKILLDCKDKSTLIDLKFKCEYSIVYMFLCLIKTRRCRAPEKANKCGMS